MLAATANAKALIESAMPLYSVEPDSKEQGVRRYHYYGVKANFGLGGDMLVMMTAKETTSGEWFYDDDLAGVEVAKAAYSAALAGRTKTGAGDTEGAAPKGRLLNWIAGVNGGQRVRYGGEMRGMADKDTVAGVESKGIVFSASQWETLCLRLRPTAHSRRQFHRTQQPTTGDSNVEIET